MLPRGRLSVLATLVTLLLSSCSFEVEGPEGFQFKEDSTGGDSLVEVPDILVAEGPADTTPDRLDSPDAIDASDASEIQEGCTSEGECVSKVECVTAACVEGKCEFTPEDALCAQPVGECSTAVCDLVAGCLAEPRTGEKCDPGVKCAAEAVCSDKGECEIVEKVQCEKPCHSGVCDEESGECVYEIVDDGPCSDDIECTGDDTCLGGECIGTPSPGKCPCGDGATCDSFVMTDLCKGKLVCMDEVCDIEPGTAVECEPAPSDSCIEHACQPETGKCVEAVLPEGASCDDLNPCTATDSCDSGGVCVGIAPVIPEGEVLGCDFDGTTCTLDYCEGGKCAPGPPKPCPAAGECSEWVCEEASGDCIQIAFTGTPCDDGDQCTKDDECIQGVCAPGIDVCVDCSQQGLAGHPCDDDDDETVGDFCFGQNCVGLAIHTWKPTGCETSALNRVSSSGNSFHAIGVKQCGDDDSYLPRFFEVSAAGLSVGESTVLGSTPLADIDGDLAVGKPNQVYRHVNDWLVAAELKSSLEEGCPCLGVTCAPVTVAYREKEGINIGGLTNERAAFLGMRVQDPDSTDCFLAMCLTTQSGQWECTGIPFANLGVELAEGMQAEATSVWAPIDWSDCNGTFAECLGATGRFYAAVRGFAQSDDSVAPVNAIVAGAKEGTGTTIEWKTLHQDGAAQDTPAGYRINDIREDDDGNFFAVGSKGFIFVQDASGAGQVVPIFQSLPAGAIHYQGIYRSDDATLLAANLLVTTTDSQGQEVYEVRAGLLAGSSDLLLQNMFVEQPFFNALSEFSICPDCYVQDFGVWGLADLAARQDHPSGLIDFGGNKAVLGVCGTAPDPLSGAPRGQSAILFP